MLKSQLTEISDLGSMVVHQCQTGDQDVVSLNPSCVTTLDKVGWLGHQCPLSAQK